MAATSPLQPLDTPYLHTTPSPAVAGMARSYPATWRRP